MPSLSEETNGRVERLMPGATIGIIGGGQLGRMMALSARYMGFRIGVLDPTPDCPTAQVADFQVTAEYDDITAIRELAEKSDVLTYAFLVCSPARHRFAACHAGSRQREAVHQRSWHADRTMEGRQQR